MSSFVSQYLTKTVEAAPLAVFRILFGLLMVVSLVRFWANGWISKLYIEPQFFFSYYGFSWVKPIGELTYVLFFLCGLAALMIAFGYYYKAACGLFFLSFTYIELMDKTTYLNHYYFISILAFLLIFLPANHYFALDAYRKPGLRHQRIPAWSIDSLKLLLSIVYFYAGLAKLNSDWLLNAMPLKIWLPSKYDLPMLGDLLQQEWVHYAFSWGGALFDLSIPILLLISRTRLFAFILVIIFHLLTRVLFPIGMFPYIMIVSCLIFFDAGLHHHILHWISRTFAIKKMLFDNGKAWFARNEREYKLTLAVICVFFVFQLIIPFRHVLYPGELFWTEEGYRFSWRVMLMEKAGYVQFKIVDGNTGKRFYVNNADFLSHFQEKQMATQPDFILEFAHFLRDHYRKQGYNNVQVYIESAVALNGRLSRPYIDPSIDLAQQECTLKHKTWILPFDDNIQGL